MIETTIHLGHFYCDTCKKIVRHVQYGDLSIRCSACGTPWVATTPKYPLHTISNNTITVDLNKIRMYIVQLENTLTLLKRELDGYVPTQEEYPR